MNPTGDAKAKTVKLFNRACHAESVPREAWVDLHRRLSGWVQEYVLELPNAENLPRWGDVQAAYEESATEHRRSFDAEHRVYQQRMDKARELNIDVGDLPPDMVALPDEAWLDFIEAQQQQLEG